MSQMHQLAVGMCVLAARFTLYGGSICGTDCNDNASVFCYDGAHGGGGQCQGEGAAAICVLELGAGTGLVSVSVSLTTAKSWEATWTCDYDNNSYCHADIVMSDFYMVHMRWLSMHTYQ